MTLRSRRRLRRQRLPRLREGSLTDVLSAELAIGEPVGLAPRRSGYVLERVIMCSAEAIMCSAWVIMCAARATIG